jgi:C-terminal processing protease CtpA/Prc
MSEADLNRAAVLGFLARLQPQVSLVTSLTAQPDVSAVPLLSRSAVLDGAYAFLRIGRVGPGLAKALGTVFDELRSTNKLRGVIVDLRFAVGYDYASAGEVANLFVKTEQPLLQWGQETVRSTAKTSAIDLSAAVLVNSYTSGAAEALAAALRQAASAVLIGSPTAGRAYLFKEFPLSDGEVMRIASGSVTIGDGQPLSNKGLAPDINLTLSFEDEKAYFEDPYRSSSRPFAQSAKPNTNDLASTQNTNRSRRRLNEAELVRMQRDGVDLEAEPPPVSSPLPGGPVINDPALARALDLLKGLAMALKRP